MKRLVFALLTVLVLLAAACQPLAAPQTGSGGQVEQPAETPVEETETPAAEEPGRTVGPASMAAIAHLAQLLGISENEIHYVSEEAVEWPDSCLGIMRIDAICAAVITPGYRVILEAGGEQYEYHTNEDGSVVAPAFEISPEASEAAVESARQALAEALGIPVEEITVAGTQTKEWPDGCLGIYQPGIMCTEALVPGLLIYLEAGGRQYEYHSNLDGSLILPATVAFNWSREGGLAGFADELIIFLPNTVIASSKSQQSEARLDVVLKPEELEQFQAWLSQYGGSSWVVQDAPAAADGMTVGTSLMGFGEEQPDDAAQEAISLFAQDLFNRMMQ